MIPVIFFDASKTTALDANAVPAVTLCNTLSSAEVDVRAVPPRVSVPLTDNDVNVPTEVMLPCAAVDIVPYIPVPTYRDLAIPTPPTNVAAPVMVEVESVIKPETSFKNKSIETQSMVVSNYNDIQSVRESIVSAFEYKMKSSLIRKSRAMYWSADHSIRLVCAVSKRYDSGEAYWCSIT